MAMHRPLNHREQMALNPYGRSPLEDLQNQFNLGAFQSGGGAGVGSLLGGGGGGLQGLAGQAASMPGIADCHREIRFLGEHVRSDPKNVREELQVEVDDWLKDIN